LETSDNWIGSRNFEEKYTRAAQDRLERGIREVTSPQEDNFLRQWKQEYTNRKTATITPGSVYQCLICEKKFKSTEFVNKHIFNKHEEVLDEKFNKVRFE